MGTGGGRWACRRLDRGCRLTRVAGLGALDAAFPLLSAFLLGVAFPGAEIFAAGLVIA